MTIYIALEEGLAVLRNVGARWTLQATLEDRRPDCVAIDPAQPRHVFCGTFDSGLWHSQDAGDSWQPVGAGIGHESVMAVAANPLEPAAHGSVIYAGTEPSALYRSEDGGATWRELEALLQLPSKPTWSFPPRPYTSHVRWITPDPVEAGTIYVCIEAGALVKTDDSGQTWIDRKVEGPWDTHTLKTHPNAPGRLYSAAGDGFMAPGKGYSESNDRADTWDRPDDGLHHNYLWSVAVDPADPNAVVVSAARGPREAHDTPTSESYLYHRSDAGPWRVASDGLPEPRGTGIWSVATNPRETGAFYAASNRGVFRSKDGGATWGSLAVDWPETFAKQRVGGLTVTSD